MPRLPTCGCARGERRRERKEPQCYQLWDEEDGYFYDVLRYPDGRHTKFRVRSLVGLVPLFAVERLESEWLENFPTLPGRLSPSGCPRRWLRRRMPCPA